MYSGYMFPFYRSPLVNGFNPGFGWGNGGYGGYGGYGGWGGYGSTNIIGSAVANQSLINTGNMLGVNQIATPTVIW